MTGPRPRDTGDFRKLEKARSAFPPGPGGTSSHRDFSPARRTSGLRDATSALFQGPDVPPPPTAPASTDVRSTGASASPRGGGDRKSSVEPRLRSSEPCRRRKCPPSENVPLSRRKAGEDPGTLTSARLWGRRVLDGLYLPERARSPRGPGAGRGTSCSPRTPLWGQPVPFAVLFCGLTSRLGTPRPPPIVSATGQAFCLLHSLPQTQHPTHGLAHSRHSAVMCRMHG